MTQRDPNSDLGRLLGAILDDDRALVERQLKFDPNLASACVGKPRLYRGQIDHWLYGDDTALHLAAAGFRVEIVRQLLKAGANPNATANHRCSGPLHYAADGWINCKAYNGKRQQQTILLLLKAGANINAQDKNGATPLHRAVRTRCTAAVRCLLEAGCDPNAKNKPGSTPFHLAVQNTGRGGSGAAIAVDAQRQIIEYLVSFRVSPDIKNARGKSARDSAQSDWIKQLLEKRS